MNLASVRPAVTSTSFTTSSVDSSSVKPLVKLSRRISFSAGLRLRHPDWDDATNQRVFGKAVGPHGAEFDLRVDLCGPIASDDGMIVNLVEVKPVLSRVVTKLDGRFLDAEIAFFFARRPTAENVARYLWDALPAAIGAATKHQVTLDQSGRGSVEITQNFMKVSRFYEFAAAHRLFTPALSEEENWQRFDKCSNPAGHGHNFGLHVWIEGTPDEQSGFIINPSLLDRIVDEEIYARFDHRHLNEDCPEFADTGKVPTTENLALLIYELLGARLEREGIDYAASACRKRKRTILKWRLKWRPNELRYQTRQTQPTLFRFHLRPRVSGRCRIHRELTRLAKRSFGAGRTCQVGARGHP